MRVCEVDSEDPISQKISKTSNNQIPIGSRDLHSNDLVQSKLEEEFSTLGYFYERKPNQYIDKPKSKILNNELLGQLFMAYHLEMPSEAKNNKAKVFSDLYDSIFDENIINATEMLRLYQLYLPLLGRKKEIQRKKRRKELVDEKEAFISRATFHIIFGTKFLFENDELLINKQDISAIEKTNLIKNLYETMGENFTEKSINWIFEVVEKQINIRGSVYTHDKFFKETPTNDLIKSHILQHLSKLDTSFDNH